MLSASAGAAIGLHGANTIYDTINAGQNRNTMTTQELMGELQNWFGPPKAQVAIGAYDDTAVQTYHLPDVYAGQSLFLRHTMIGMITRQNEWPTTLALPWARTDQQNFQWSEFKFNNTLCGEVPHEGIPRLLTSTSRSFASGTKRRGLAFLLEHGFWRTPQGRMMYQRNFIGIRQAVQETANFEVSFAISNARNTYKEFQREKGVLNVSVAKLMDYETWSFAAVHKSVTGFDHMLGLLQNAMSEQSVTPDILIAPPGFRMYYQKLDPLKTQYWSFGPEGVMALKQGPEASGVVGGMLVVESRKLDLSRTEGPSEPFLKTIRHGEYYPMIDENMNDDHIGFTSAERNITVWDEQATKYVKLTLRDAITYSGRWDVDGKLNEVHSALANEAPTAGKLTMQDPSNNPYMVSRAAETLSADRLAAEFRDMFLYKRDNEKTFGVTHFFGLMETVAATYEDFREVAKTAAQQTFGGDWEAAKATLEDLQDLVHRSESVPYNVSWWLHSQRVNAPRQAANPPRSTDPDVAQHRSEPRVRELVPNDFGGMDLPARTGNFPDMSVPPHINSWPQLRTLAAQRSQNSGWDEAAGIASAACSMITRLTKKAAEVFGSSLFLNPLNRQPWFQLANSETVVTSEILLAPRDGVFMRMIPNATIVADAEPPVKTASSSTTPPKKPATGYQIKAASDILSELIDDAELLNVAGALMRYAANGNDTELPESLARLVLAIATDNIDVRAYSDADCKSARCRARRVIRQFAAAVAGKSDKEAHDTIRASVERLNPLVSPSDTPAVIKAAEELKNKMIEGRSRSVKLDASGKIVVEQTVITEEQDNAKPADPKNMVDWAAWRTAVANNTPQQGATPTIAVKTAPYQSGPQDVDIEVTADQWAAGYWIRVPLCSYKTFAETALVQEYPLALPSNPELRHLAPIEPSIVGSARLNAIFKRPQYTVHVQKNTEAKFGASAVLEAMEVADIPKDVWAESAPTPATNAIEASRKRLLAQQQQQQPAEAVRRPPQQLTSMLASIVKPADSPASSHQSRFGSGYHPLESRDREPRDRRGEYRDWEREHTQSYGDKATTEMLGGGGGGGVVDAALRYSAFTVTLTDLRRDLTQSVFTGRWKKGSLISDPVVRFFHQVLLGTRVLLTSLWDMIDGHIMPPVNAIAWRLNITRRMYQMPAMVGGYDTGATFYGSVDVLLGDDVYSKIHYANCTFNMVPLIVEGRNVGMAENAIAHSYDYGNGTEWVKGKEDLTWDHRRPNGDIISTLIPYRETKFHEPMDLYGQFSEPDANPNYMTREEKELHYTSAAYYTSKYNLRETIIRKVARQVEPRYGQTNITLPQTIAFQGWYATYDKTRGRNTIVHTPGKCHTGEKGVGPVASAVFNGRHALLPDNIYYAEGS